jgi:hypothetical protein
MNVRNSLLHDGAGQGILFFIGNWVEFMAVFPLIMLIKLSRKFTISDFAMTG